MSARSINKSGPAVSAIGLATLVAAAWPVALQAQTSPTARPPTSAEPSTPADAAQPEDDDSIAVDELVVTGARRPPGAVVGDIKPELSLSPAVIQSYGVSTVSELLDELAPQTRSDRARGEGDAPVVLLNGRRISGMNEVRSIPTEAILRVEVLPEEAGLKYGYAPDQRVVNIILRRRFRAVSAELKGGAATEGGDVGGEAEIDLFRLHHDSRANFDLKYQQVSAITEAERDLVLFPEAHPYARAGNVVSPLPGAEIDPALSALVGRPVTIAGVPSSFGGQRASLADFAATAGIPNVTDVRAFRTLTPATRNVSANAVYARPLATDFTLTLNATLAALRSQSEEGLPGVRLQVPANDPFSPFSRGVEVDRYADAPGPLRRETDTWTGGLGAGVNGDAGKWRIAATGAYDHADAVTRSDGGADATAFQASLLQGSAGSDPFRGSLDLPLRPADEARSRLDTTNMNLSASGPVFRAPGGSAYASFALQDTGAWLASDSVRRGQSQATRRARNDIGVRANFDLPIARRLAGRPLGELWLNANGGVDQVSDFGALPAFGYGLNWSPRAGVNLLVSRTEAQIAPTLQQVGDPLAVADRAYLLDFATGQAVDVRRLAGGDPALVPERRKSLKVGVTLTPLAIHNLTISATYLDTRVDNPIGVFPAATSAIQQAFPGRFVRDATGRLVEVDVSPVNFAWERTRELRWGLNYVRRVGAVSDARRGLQSSHGPPTPGEGASADVHAHHFPRGASASSLGTSLQFALYHTVYFQDALALRPGGAPVDLLDGGAASALGGQPRHEIEAQAGVMRNGLGARLSADWRSPTAIRDAAPGAFQSLTFSQAPQLNLRLFANLDGDPELVRRHPLLHGARFTVSVSDLFDSRIRVRSPLGPTPVSYQPAYLEPVGRVVRLSFRKLLQ